MDEERELPATPYNWSIRNTTFILHTVQGMDIQQAYDLAMCSMYRAEGIDLPWGKPSAHLLRMLRNYEPKRGEEE